MEKYLIVGTGGVGGSIAGFLALAGKDVTCIARGKHLEAIREKGLHLRSDLKGNHFLPIQACTAEEYNEKANVIFVCVKGYSLDSIKDLLEKASKSHKWAKYSGWFSVHVPNRVWLRNVWKPLPMY